MNNWIKKNIVNVTAFMALASLVFASNFSPVIAAVMTSSSYKIQSDSVNVGGLSSGSASYGLQDTAGEVATGDSSSASFNLKAGYQQMVSTYLAITSASDVVMSPSLGGVGGGTSNGSAATTVTTDNPAGYSLYFKASSTPAMQGNANGDTIANYTPAGSDPDFAFSVDSNSAEFAFTPEGTDVAPEYLDNGAACNVGGVTDTADSCWGPVTTSNKLVATRASANNPSGTVTTIKFRLKIGSSVVKTEDDYTATTTLTAIAL